MLLEFGDGCGCYSDALDGALVTPSADAEEAILSPAGSPAVLDNPVLLPSLVAVAVAHQQHSMVGQLEWIEGVCEARVVVDAPGIVHEVRVDLWTNTKALKSHSSHLL